MVLPSHVTSQRRFSFAGLSTGIKMLLILTGALLPLGVIALFASIQSAHSKRIQREIDARVVATAEARQIDILLLRSSSLIRSALAPGTIDAARCRRLAALSAETLQAPVRIRLFDGAGRLRCGDPKGAASILPPGGIGAEVTLVSDPAALRFTVAGAGGSYGVAELPASVLARTLPTGDPAQGIVLAQGDRWLTLSEIAKTNPLDERLNVSAPFANGQATLSLTVATNLITAVEVLLVLLPILMWAAAAAIGWAVVDQLLLRPLAQLQRAVAAYKGEGLFELPRLATPSHEIRALGEAFQNTAHQLAHREAELEQGLNHQVRLTREVHHRVKNNLQVVASLINLHSRGTKGDVAAAYASIQRRVDALAVVHRNHYAELEENRGVALRSIIAELTANLRATAPPEASHLTITLDMMPAFITQDVAVPVAFLVTEIVELVMECDPRGRVAIALGPTEQADRALLSIESLGLVYGTCSQHPSYTGFERIITGLSRQLRATLEYDQDAGRYTVIIAIVPQGETEA